MGHQQQFSLLGPSFDPPAYFLDVAAVISVALLTIDVADREIDRWREIVIRRGTSAPIGTLIPWID